VKAQNDDALVELPRGSGELILIVDDETSILQITRQTLEAFGYRVLVASDGTEAVAIYAKRRAEIALVLTDIMMPIMDGIALIQILKKMQPNVRIIAASGITANANVTKLAGVGVEDFLPKPYTAVALLNILKKRLGEKDEKKDTDR
jgi:CheY-like chemotaxis protein